MRHQKKGRKFTRSKDQKKALLRSLSSALIMSEKIVTTEAKAKELRPYIEKRITRAKKDTIANRRLLAKDFSDKAVKKLFKELGPRYSKRHGGYTRIVKMGPRKTDSAKISLIEFVK